MVVELVEFVRAEIAKNSLIKNGLSKLQKFHVRSLRILVLTLECKRVVDMVLACKTGGKLAAYPRGQLLLLLHGPWCVGLFDCFVSPPEGHLAGHELHESPSWSVHAHFHELSRLRLSG